MPRIAYVNGRYLPHHDAVVHVEDRGYQFADGVYEVVGVRHGRLIDEEPHLDRLDRSLAALKMESPLNRAAIRHITREMVRRNYIRDGIIYLQISRGVAPRDQQFPSDTAASVVMTARRKFADAAKLRAGVRVISLKDIRWARPDIKSVSLLPNVLCKQQAVEAGAYEAWQVDAAGLVTEGTSSNAWIVTSEGRLLTHDADRAILNGITRRTLLGIAAEQGLDFGEEAFSVAQAKTAQEAFLTSSSSFVLPVIQIDEAVIGTGTPGPFTRRLQESYERYIHAIQPIRENAAGA